MTPPELPPQSRQLHLPLFPEGTVEVSSAVSVVTKEGTVWYFHQGVPIFTHAVGDVASFRLYSSTLCDSQACRLVDIVRAFQVSSISVKRALKEYRAKGPRAFFGKVRAQRGTPVLTEEVRQRVQAWLDDGLTTREAAEKEGLKRDTVYRAIKEGRLRAGLKKKAP